MSFIDQIRRDHHEAVEKMAEHLFNTSEITSDRSRYVTFYVLPNELKGWWRDRAARHIHENRLLSNDNHQ